MIYLCFGITKSGSTLAYELTRALLAALGHPQERLDIPLIKREHEVNFLDRQAMDTFDRASLDLVEASAPPPRILAFKTHAPPNAFVGQLAAEGLVMGQANFRDPRDNLLSLLDAGHQAKQRGHGGFLNIQSWKLALEDYERDRAFFEQWLRLPGFISIHYEEVAFRSESFLHRVATQLDLTVPDSLNLTELSAQVKANAFTQFNKGIARRHRDELSLNQNLFLLQRFGVQMERHMPEDLDAVDRALLDASRQLPPVRVEDEQCLPLRPPSEEAGRRGWVEGNPSQMRPPETKQSRSWMPNFLKKSADYFTHNLFNFPHSGKIRTQRTFVVLGCPRGGTSLLAGALDAAGVSMGRYRTLQYEDPDFKIPPHEAAQARQRLEPVIQHRNAMYPYWGWKIPNNIYYIEQVIDLLVDPCFLFIYRDPQEIARSSARHDGRDWSEQGEQLLKIAKKHTARVRAFQASLKLEHHVFQLEAIQADPEAFADRILTILHPMSPSREKIIRFVVPEGGYHAHTTVSRQVRKR